MVEYMHDLMQIWLLQVCQQWYEYAGCLKVEQWIFAEINIISFNQAININIYSNEVNSRQAQFSRSKKFGEKLWQQVRFYGFP